MKNKEIPQFDEFVAGVFCSKRRTGQFNDRFETGEIELSLMMVGNNGGAELVAAGDSWSKCVVHDLDNQDFSALDDIMEWPADYNEASDLF